MKIILHFPIIMYVTSMTFTMPTFEIPFTTYNKTSFFYQLYPSMYALCI